MTQIQTKLKTDLFYRHYDYFEKYVVGRLDSLEKIIDELAKYAGLSDIPKDEKVYAKYVRTEIEYTNPPTYKSIGGARRTRRNKHRRRSSIKVGRRR